MPDRSGPSQPEGPYEFRPIRALELARDGADGVARHALNDVEMGITGKFLRELGD